MRYAIKVREVGKKKWRFLSSSGGVTNLRVHAAPDFDGGGHPVIDFLTNVLALSQSRFSTALTPHSVEADVIADVRDLIVESVTDRARSTGWGRQLPIGQYIEPSSRSIRAFCHAVRLKILTAGMLLQASILPSTDF